MTKHDNVSQGKIMKATEFVKKFGWERAKREVALIGTIAVITGDRNWLSELKRLVESHKLVIVWRMPEGWRDSYDGDELGLHGAKMYLDMYGNYELVGDELERFKQAIADVEACQ